VRLSGRRLEFLSRFLKTQKRCRALIKEQHSESKKDQQQQQQEQLDSKKIDQ
jgi:hypothetical protein